MVPAFIDPGWLGSPVDVATFVVVLGLFVYELRPEVEVLGAAVVALALDQESVDDELLRRDLDVDRRDVRALRTDGGDDAPDR